MEWVVTVAQVRHVAKEEGKEEREKERKYKYKTSQPSH